MYWSLETSDINLTQGNVHYIGMAMQGKFICLAPFNHKTIQSALHRPLPLYYYIHIPNYCSMDKINKMTCKSVHTGHDHDNDV